MKHFFFLLLLTISFGCSKKQVANFQPSRRELILAEKEISSANLEEKKAKLDTLSPVVVEKNQLFEISKDTIIKEKKTSNISKLEPSKLESIKTDSLGKKIPNYVLRSEIAGSIAASTFVVGFIANLIFPGVIPFIVLTLIAALIGGILGINSIKKVKNKSLAILGIIIGSLSTITLLAIGFFALLLRNME